jgi:acetyl-CoA C-acetyltransferase
MYEGMKMGDSLLVDAFAYGVSHVQPPELYPGLNMGLTAENIAKKYHITRQMADQFALESQIKTHKAKLSGKLSQEILPVEIIEKKSRILFEEDEHPRPDTSLEALGKLKPVFLKDGSGIVTAGNSSGMNDGASAVVVMSEDKALQMGIPPLVRIISWATAGVDPALMGLGPVPAIQKALKKASLSLEDMDLIEINEAFATQTLGCLKELGIEMNSPDYHKVNVNGGAIAQGHALGSSGTRILTTLIHELNRRKGRYGVASLCIGGGQGIALIIENFHYK